MVIVNLTITYKLYGKIKLMFSCRWLQDSRKSSDSSEVRINFPIFLCKFITWSNIQNCDISMSLLGFCSWSQLETSQFFMSNNSSSWLIKHETSELFRISDLHKSPSTYKRLTRGILFISKLEKFTHEEKFLTKPHLQNYPEFITLNHPFSGSTLAERQETSKK